MRGVAGRHPLPMIAGVAGAIPDLRLREPGPGGAAFDIEASPAYALTPAERTWCDRVRTLLARLAQVRAMDTALPGALQESRLCASSVREGALAVVAASQPARDAVAVQATYDTYWYEAVMEDRLDRLGDVPFAVEPVLDESKHWMIDIKITIRDKPLPADKQKFKVQLDQVQTVVRTVLLDPGGAAPSWVPATLRWVADWFFGILLPRRAVTPEARLDQYMRALLGIARVGLVDMDATHTPFAALALLAFQQEFVGREAGRIKNRYVRRLGWHAALVLLVAVLGYAWAAWLGPDWTVNRFRNFFLLAAGAAVGTWLSFSIRRQVLGFADLALLEEDRLNPGLRVLFMVALTTVVGLILWTGMVKVDIGDFRTDFRLTGTYAALIGALCGIAERSLATAVGRRADDFAVGLGGGAKPGA